MESTEFLDRIAKRASSERSNSHQPPELQSRNDPSELPATRPQLRAVSAAGIIQPVAAPTGIADPQTAPSPLRVITTPGAPQAASDASVSAELEVVHHVEVPDSPTRHLVAAFPAADNEEYSDNVSADQTSAAGTSPVTSAALEKHYFGDSPMPTPEPLVRHKSAEHDPRAHAILRSALARAASVPVEDPLGHPLFPSAVESQAAPEAAAGPSTAPAGAPHAADGAAKMEEATQRMEEAMKQVRAMEVAMKASEEAMARNAEAMAAQQQVIQELQASQQKTIETAVNAQVESRMKHMRATERRGEEVGGNVDKFELMELIMMKKDIRNDLNTLRPMRVSLASLQERMGNVEQKVGLMKQALEVATQGMRVEINDCMLSIDAKIQPVKMQQESDTQALSQCIQHASEQGMMDVQHLRNDLQASVDVLPSLSAKVARLEGKMGGMMQEVHDEIETMREHMRGSMKAMFVDIIEARERVTLMEHKEEVIAERVQYVEDSRQQESLDQAGTGPTSSAGLQQAKSQVDAVNRTLNMNITAVSDSVAWLHDRVASIEKDQEVVDSENSRAGEQVREALAKCTEDIGRLRMDVVAEMQEVHQRLTSLEKSNYSPKASPPSRASFDRNSPRASFDRGSPRK